jgi:hypothetical protein
VDVGLSFLTLAEDEVVEVLSLLTIEAAFFLGLRFEVSNKKDKETYCGRNRRNWDSKSRVLIGDISLFSVSLC